ncbi:PI31 proteasome regulator N-terminal-domain-containing protein [Bombardia bombarda]|uniref:PI31 proteasome regulator N-terminal-domain-containing protein n=1 Tax=Bombardia bombarda TaxID=252184 RepID=A0AA39XN50_9PEZI|nr:PI31 proteasome regulator N-terminal-domain-containing protein [Bombardia bombarda]
MSRNPLDPASILDGMAEALPTHEKGDTTSDLSSSLDAVALFTHACMVGLGFRLLGFNEDHKIESECAKLAPRLPPHWNSSLNSHSFVYAHTQSSMQFIIRVDRMGGKAEIRGLALNSLFISPDRIADLASLLKINIIQRLLPNLQKEGYQESSPDDRAARQDADDFGRAASRLPPINTPQPHPPTLPSIPHPYGPGQPAGIPRQPIPAGDFPPPSFDDEYDLNRPPRGRGGLPLPGYGSGTPFDYGRSDLYPRGLGPDDPMRGSFAPPAPGLRRPGRTGGMHPTFDDPLFMGPHGGGENPQFDPQAPLGARWDPLGPGGAPRFGGGRGSGSGGGGFGGGFGGGGFGGDII